MSFRNRLTLFFVVIVVVPMIAVALLLFRLIADSEAGKADAGVATAERSAVGLYRLYASSASAHAAVAAVSADAALGRSLARGDATAAQHHVEAILSRTRIVRLQVVNGGRILADAGRTDAVAPITRELVDAHGTVLGRLELSLHDAASYIARVHRLTGADAVAAAGGRLLASSRPGMPATLPDVGDVKIGGRGYRVASFGTGSLSFAGPRVRISILEPRSTTTSAINHSRLVAAAVLLGFLVLAIAFALLVSRSLQQQIAAFLDAARRLGRGDFTTRAPSEGNDEFAALGTEFNRMSEQLESRLVELREQRARLERSLQRIGETFASNLDREALLAIVLRTATDAVAATAGRASGRATGGNLREIARVGDLGVLRGAVYAAEAASLRSGEPSNVSEGDSHALAHPLGVADEGPVTGLISVARAGKPFDEAEAELFDYLARQAAVSVENVGLHEQVQRQAVTDELTGLYNHRRFQEALDAEIGRARRFDQPVGLVMLDLDNFKRINDTRGHQQGDQVLRDVAGLLREFSREIDAPARYGGEELALVLPQTDLEGAFQLAERLREGIETHDVRLIAGDGTMKITASLGVAAFPDSADDPSGLVAAADAALYDAKRAGKNKTMRASVGLDGDGTARRRDPRAS